MLSSIRRHTTVRQLGMNVDTASADTGFALNAVKRASLLPSARRIVICHVPPGVTASREVPNTVASPMNVIRSSWTPAADHGASGTPGCCRSRFSFSTFNFPASAAAPWPCASCLSCRPCFISSSILSSFNTTPGWATVPMGCNPTAGLRAGRRLCARVPGIPSSSQR